MSIRTSRRERDWAAFTFCEARCGNDGIGATSRGVTQVDWLMATAYDPEAVAEPKSAE